MVDYDGMQLYIKNGAKQTWYNNFDLQVSKILVS